MSLYLGDDIVKIPQDYNIQNDPILDFIGTSKLVSYVNNKSSITYIPGSLFRNYSVCSIGNLTLPNCTTIGSYAFNTTDITGITANAISQVSYGAFAYCTSLNYASLTNLSSSIYLGQSAFYNCSKLMTVYLNTSEMVSIYNSYTFMYTPLYRSSYTGSFGSIYVPASLVSTYQSASY